MFKILIKRVCGEGIQSFAPTEEFGDHVFSHLEEAAAAVVSHYGQGMVTTLEGEFVLHV
jgi:hypothetical protein